MRADALRNRQAVVRAARALFVERGIDVALDAIAQRAGVSIATLYRNFPDRRALVRAVAMDGTRALREAARQAAQRIAADPGESGEAWREFAAAAAALQAGVLLSVILPKYADLGAELRPTRDEAVRAVAELVTAAQRHGQVRTDVSFSDVILTIINVTRPIPLLPEEHQRAFAERALHIALAGLRPDAGDPLPGEPTPEPPI